MCPVSSFAIVSFKARINVIKRGCWVVMLMENWTSFDIMKKNVKLV
jgi:hypothetical protein